MPIINIVKLHLVTTFDLKLKLTNKIITANTKNQLSILYEIWVKITELIFSVLPKIVPITISINVTIIAMNRYFFSEIIYVLSK